MVSAIQTAQAAALAPVAAVDDMVEAYLADADVCEKSRATYRRALRNFTAWLAAEAVPIEQTTRANVLAYKRHLEDGYSAATVSAYLCAVRGLYGWLEANKLYPNVAAGIKGAKRGGRSARDALTLEQARAIVADEPETARAKRDYAMVNLMLRRGLRTIEIVRADVGDLRQLGGEAVLYVQGKGHSEKDDFIVLGEAVLRPINDYLATRSDLEDGAPLFAAIGNRNAGGRMTTRSISRIVQDAYRAHGIVSPRITAHSLRHSAVTFAIMGGADVTDAQAMARHGNISTTMIYYHGLQRMAARAEHGVDAVLAGA